MDEQLTAVFSALFSSGSNSSQHPKKNASREKLLQSFIEDQLKVNEAIQRKRKKKPQMKKKKEAMFGDSDEELKAELSNALRKYKSNRKTSEFEQSKPEIDSRQKCVSERYNGEKSSNGGTNGNGDASSDFMELINCFFGSQKSGSYLHEGVKSYSEYEKQGAIPKRLVKNESNGSKSLDAFGGVESKGKNSAPKSKWSNQTLGDNVTNFSEETYSLPFFYIVPENPSPEFFLPRGSYYVVPRVPDSSAEVKIVFHPEKSIQGKKKNKTKPNLKSSSSEMNNLSKDAIQKMDSHLNIGPLDVKITNFSDNLENNYDGNKMYDKTCLSPSDSGTPSEVDEPTVKEERLSSTEEELLADLLISQSEESKIDAQFARLCSALPGSNVDELREKCIVFKGDETLVDAYIQQVQFENKVLQRILDLQHIFPDADPNFLRNMVEDADCNDGEIGTRIDELLEGRDYPKISDDPGSMEKSRLWNKYFRKFDVKEYIREVRDPQVYTRSVRNENRDTGLVYKYLQAKYPNMSLYDLKSYFKQEQNLTNTCALLNLNEVIGRWEKAIENEEYTEEFLREICYIEHREQIDKYMKEVKERREIEREDAFANDCFLTCPLCSDDEVIPSDVVTCPEGHVFCTECVTQYVTVKMSDGVYKFPCPSEKCEMFFTFSVLEKLLSETVMLNIMRKQQAEEISVAEVEGLESCPYCEFAYIPSPEDKIFRCGNPACLTETCRKCKEKSHIPLRCEEIERPADLEARKKIEETMSEKLMRVCPKCRKKIVKIDGCNKIACSCGALFCYICQQSVTGYGHFDRYSSRGCPLYSSNEELHNGAVIRAGIQARDEILRQNPNVRLMNDPTEQI